MDIRKVLKDIVWLSPWKSARETGVGPEALALAAACATQPAPEPAVDLSDVIGASKRFPLPFPVHTARLEQLKTRCPARRLLRNVQSTYPLMHERVVILIANFILYKRKYGSNVEKELYADMGIVEFVDRLMLKRAATFMKAQDQYKLLSGETGKDGWESVGTDAETPPLLLRNCLSYDEMKVSALVGVSGYTECVNDGARKNAGVVCTENVEPTAVIIGVVGARFKRAGRMDCEDALVSPEQHVAENGYGPDAADEAKKAYRKLWDDFYQIPSITHAALTREVKLVPCTGRRVFSQRWAGVRGGGFDNRAYSRRVELIADMVLLEAEKRAREEGTVAFVNVIGAGLGIWKHSIHQIEVYVLTWLARVTSLLDAGALDHVSDVNFAYIPPKKEVLELFRPSKGDNKDVKSMFIKNDKHPTGGISAWLESREPSARLRGDHAGKLLVLTYAWDSNALPGNEYWIGKLSTSGDSAAACATQVAELHNAHVNALVCGARAHVAAGAGLVALQDYCRGLNE